MRLLSKILPHCACNAAVARANGFQFLHPISSISTRARIGAKDEHFAAQPSSHGTKTLKLTFW